MVNCPEDFDDQPKVVNGASDLLVQLRRLGPACPLGSGDASSAFGIAVEIEMIFEVA
jgi:hypothetical protein